MTFKEKLNQVYKMIDHVEKGGENTSQHYRYVKAVDVVRAVREMFAELKIYAQVQMDFAGPSYTIARAKEPNAPFTAVNVKCSLTLEDLESDELRFGSGLGTGADGGDKAVYKAQTGALKYALRNACLLPDEAGMDPEADPTTDENNEPDFQDARRGTPAPQHKTESKKNPTPAPAKASAASAPAPATETKPTSGATAAAAPATPKASVQAAEIPTQASLPATQSTLPMTSEVSTDSADKMMPTEAELNDYRKRYTSLGNDLSEPAKGGLKTSKSNPINRKILAYMLTYVKAYNATEVTKAQWTSFLAHVDGVIAENGYKGLARLIDPAAFESKK